MKLATIIGIKHWQSQCHPVTGLVNFFWVALASPVRNRNWVALALPVLGVPSRKAVATLPNALSQIAGLLIAKREHPIAGGDNDLVVGNHDMAVK